MKSKNKLRRKGFSLIELIIVLAVMAVLALIAIPNFNAVMENSKVKADIQTCEAIKRTVEILLLDESIKIQDGGEGSSNSIFLDFDDNGDLKSLDLKGIIGGQDNRVEDAKKILESALANVKMPQSNSIIHTEGDPEESRHKPERYHVWVRDGKVEVMTLVKK